MGFLKNESGFQLLGKTPPGTCPLCATVHEPELPHNWQSLCYQYKFYDEHGRWPTWRDAMAHCSNEVKQLCINALQERGVSID